MTLPAGAAASNAAGASSTAATICGKGAACTGSGCTGAGRTSLGGVAGLLAPHPAAVANSPTIPNRFTAFMRAPPACRNADAAS